MFPVFLATIQKGKLVFNNPDAFEKYLLRLNDKSVDVVVRLPRKDRTNPQNRYMWGVVYELLSEFTGYTPSEIHDAMRMLFLQDNLRKIPTLRSTTELTTVEMETYLSQIKQWAAEQNLVIPDPNQVEV
jgi:hypothetical protein